MIKKNNPLVTIIIPVYNVEKFLPQCLDSILSQTFTDWECILIDDGSPDSSGKICDEYATGDSRFKVVHQENSGASTARNIGLLKATGKWINFIDSDDWIDSDTFEVALNIAEKYDVDFIQWGIAIEQDGKIIGESRCNNGFFSTKDLMTCFEPSACNKLFLKEIIDKNHLQFPSNLTLSEDRYFSFLYYVYAKKLYGIDRMFYHYRMNVFSATHNMTEKNIQDEIKILNLIENFIVQEDVDIVFNEILLQQKIEAKNHAIFLLKPPNCKLWRTIYPTIVPKILKINDKKILIYLLLIIRCDFLAKFIIQLYFRLKHKPI